MKNYLIAYMSGNNGNILATYVCAENQAEAIAKWKARNEDLCELIAVTEIEKIMEIKTGE